jgi:Conserved in the green lineage and diatoms 27
LLPRSEEGQRRRSHDLAAVDNNKGKDDGDDLFDSLLPETSFGSEAVPEDQRPVNEYLDVTRQPLFDWASQESGSKGLFTRLAIFYAVIFGAICYPISGASEYSRQACTKYYSD